jgi:hypothetical protein
MLAGYVSNAGWVNLLSMLACLLVGSAGYPGWLAMLVILEAWLCSLAG